MSSWEGYSVSLRSAGAWYQGVVAGATTDGSRLSLVRAFRDGRPCGDVTLRAADCSDLRLLSAPSQAAQPDQPSTVALPRVRRVPRPAVCDELQPPPPHTHDGGGGSGGRGGAGRGKTGDTPRTSRARGRRRGDRCLADTDVSDPALLQDFDFQGNLALFDKLPHSPPCTPRAAHLASRPDLLRHDENVLPPPPPLSPDGSLSPGPPPRGLYRTDAGVELPGASGSLRAGLWAALRSRGLRDEATLLLARATADLALRLLGGPRRLEHAAGGTPLVLALLSAHWEGACGAAACRLLRAHGVRTAAAADEGADPAALRRVTQAGGEVVSDSRLLPGGAELVLVCGHVSAGLLRVAAAARGGRLLLEPPEEPPLAARASLVGLVPPAPHPALGRLFLANVAAPLGLVSGLGAPYDRCERSFGAATLLALHPADPVD